MLAERVYTGRAFSLSKPGLNSQIQADELRLLRDRHGRVLVEAFAGWRSESPVSRKQARAIEKCPIKL
jgi:hypothetical protein